MSNNPELSSEINHLLEVLDRDIKSLRDTPYSLAARTLTASYQKLSGEPLADEQLKLLKETLSLAHKIISTPSAVTAKDMENQQANLKEIARLADKAKGDRTKAQLYYQIGIAVSVIVTLGLYVGLASFLIFFPNPLTMLAMSFTPVLIGVPSCAYFGNQLEKSMSATHYENIHRFFVSHMNSEASGQDESDLESKHKKGAPPLFEITVIIN